MRVNVRAAAVAFGVSVLVATGSSNAASTALTGKMSLYNYLLDGKWSCNGGGSAYSAEYVLVPRNTLHGRLYSAQGSEDAYFGYRDAAHRFWTVSADSNGATESQTSADGVTYTGKLNDGKVTSNATNLIHMVSSRRWTVQARGTAGGQPVRSHRYVRAKVAAVTPRLGHSSSWSLVVLVTPRLRHAAYPRDALGGRVAQRIAQISEVRANRFDSVKCNEFTAE